MLLRAALVLFMVLINPGDGVAFTPLDAFLIVGQSNADGRGDGADSPAVSAAIGLQLYRHELKAGRDPVGGARTGSAWPAFINAYHATTLRRVLIIPAAWGSSSLLTSGANSWGPEGELWARSAALVTEAVRETRQQGYAMTLRGIIMAQGEVDGRYISEGLFTGADYEAALIQFIARYRVRYRADLPFYIIRSGKWRDGEYETGMQQVRAAQGRVSTADPFTRIVYHDAIHFPVRGWMADEVHWNQDALNDIGTKAGVTIGKLQ